MLRKLVIAVGGAIVVVGGCGPKVERPVRICPGKGDVGDSLSLLRAQGEKAVGLKGNGQCRLELYVEDKPKPHKENFPLKLWFNPPDDILLQGDIAFNARGIVAGSNAREFWLSIKPEVSSYWWGEWSEQEGFDELPLQPKVFLEALGMVEVGGEEDWSLSNEGAFDVLVRRDGRGVTLKKVYIYSCDYQVSRIEYFDGDGEVAARAELSAYKDVGRGFSVPSVIEIVTHAKHRQEHSVRISLGSIRTVSFTEGQERGLFARREPRGFKSVFKVVNGELLEQAQ
ncbi:MAG: LolA-like protein [Planctomycetota bacterium]